MGSFTNTEAIEICRATGQDVPAIIRLLADDPLGRSRDDTAHPPAKEYVDAFAAINAAANQFLAVARRRGDIVGVLQLSFIPGLSRKGMWRGQIESVRVARSLRGKGLGRELFTWAIGQCRMRGCGLVQITTDATRPDAHEFYRALGFQPPHVGFKLAL